MHATSAVAKSPLLKSFYPSLDGLRGIAVLAVFACHYAPAVQTTWLGNWGWAGVNLFFVISGFLITGILLDSLHRADYFRNFYVRRTLRIFPLYYAVWLTLLLLTPVFHFQWNRYVVAMAFYAGNLFTAGGRLGFHPLSGALFYPSFRHLGRANAIQVDHFWSLCVEEQFYLLWPALLWILRSRKTLLIFCLVIVLASPFARAYEQHADPAAAAFSLYYNSFFRFDALLLGAVVSLWLRSQRCPSPRLLRRIGIAAFLLCPLLLALVLARRGGIFPFVQNATVLTLGVTLINASSAGLLLWSLAGSPRLTRVLRFPALVHIGRISYGLYVYSGLLNPVYTSVVQRAPHLWQRWTWLAVALLSSITLAELSFRFLESPFLRLKQTLAPRRGFVSDPPPSSQPVYLEPSTNGVSAPLHAPSVPVADVS